jgi:hypothetical protein
MAGDGHKAIRADRDEDLRIVTPPVRHAVGTELLLLRIGVGRQADGKHQRPSSNSSQEPTPADVRDRQFDFFVVCHGRPPVLACLMAARMRG